MEKKKSSTRRQLLQILSGAAMLPLLSSCGTIIYPDRVNQKKRGDLDFIVVGMDAVGLLFFLVPGIIAFAVDFGTGAIYFPENHKKGTRETTIFDKIDNQVQTNQPVSIRDVEKIVSERTGRKVKLQSRDIRTMRIEHLDQFAMARLTAEMSLAAN